MASVERTETTVSVNLTADEAGMLYRTLQWACSELDGSPDLRAVPGMLDLRDFFGTTYYATPEGQASIDYDEQTIDLAVSAFDGQV